MTSFLNLEAYCLLWILNDPKPSVQMLIEAEGKNYIFVIRDCRIGLKLSASLA